MSIPRKNGTAPAVSRPVRQQCHPSASVAIISHNYGRFLGEAIESVLSQSLYPESVIVIDDSSTDDTSDVTSQYSSYGVDYFKTSFKSAWKNRIHASHLATSKWLLCLDADNTLDRDYLRQAVLTGDRDRNCGIVYPSLQQFGLSSKFVDLSSPRNPVSVENFIDAGAVYRREAIVQSSRLWRNVDAEKSAEDWVLARSVISDGWKCHHNPVPLNYRIHSRNKHAKRNKHDRMLDGYFQDAGLESEPVTIVIPLAGRDSLWSMTKNWLNQQSWPASQCRLILIDNSHSMEFSDAVKDWMRSSLYEDIHYIRDHRGYKGLADEPRTGRRLHDRNVHQSVAGLYNRAFQSVGTDYTLTIEDDIDPPLDAISLLLRSMDASTAAVSGAYMHREGNRWLAWTGTTQNQAGVTEQDSGCQEISGSGFGCLLARTSIIQDMRLTTDGPTMFYDTNAFDLIRKLNWKVKLNWGVKCKHLAGAL